MDTGKLALVTGANRGLGRETARQLALRGWRVALGARADGAAARTATALAAELGAPLGRDPFIPLRLDLASSHDVAEVARTLAPHGRLDALVNNAGAILEQQARSSVAASDPAVVLATFDNNVLGALRLTQALLPLLPATPGGANVVNVSSGMGGLAEMGGGWVGYRLSKASLNALTRILHAEHQAAGLRVYSVCPGWVRTDMGGPDASRDVQAGAAGIVWAATQAAGSPSGGFYRDGVPIPW